MAIGAAVGLAAAWSVKRLRDRELLAPALDGYHAIATVLVIYGLAEVAGAYGFLAAFAGGLAFRRYEHDHEVNARVHEGAELTEKLLELAVILLLGSMLTLAGLRAPGWEGWLLGGARDRRRPPARLPRRARRARSSTTRARRRSSPGSACAASARCSTSRSRVEAGVLAGAERELVVWTVIACVLLSIVVHGITAGPVDAPAVQAAEPAPTRRRADAARRSGRAPPPRAPAGGSAARPGSASRRPARAPGGS